jgi:hypothetical protein
VIDANEACRRAVTTGSISGSGTIVGERHTDFTNTTYNVTGLVDLCKICAANHDEAIERARKAGERALWILMFVLIPAFLLPFVVIVMIVLVASLLHR